MKDKRRKEERGKVRSEGEEEERREVGRRGRKRGKR